MYWKIVIFGEVIADEQSEINDGVCDVDDGFVFHESPISLEESYNFMNDPYFPSLKKIIVAPEPRSLPRRAIDAG